MKARCLLAFAVLVAGILIVLAFSVHGVVATQSLVTPPTQAPTATAGPAPTLDYGEQSATPGVGQAYLATPEQVLARALQIDEMMSTWAEPWSVATLRSDPMRIAVRLFSTMTAESAGAGRDEHFAPGADAGVGPVWRITIRGNVQPSIPSMAIGSSTAVYDGITYVVAQKTGDFVAIITGKLVPGVAAPTPTRSTASHP